MKKLRANTKRAKALLLGFYILLVLLLVSEFMIHKHAEFPWEGLPFFSPLFSFVSCIIFITAAGFLGLILKRKEDYYD